MNRFFVTAFFLAPAVFISHAQSSNGNVCQMVVYCYADADKALQSCQPSVKDQNSDNVKQMQSKGTKQDDCDVRDLQAEVETKIKLQRKEYADCVQSRLSLSYDVTVLLKPQDGKLKKCQTAIQNYLNHLNNTGDNHKIIEQCKKNANDKLQRCRDLSECCSENNVCNLSFELSDLHDQLRGFQRDITVKLHDCDARKVTMSLSSNNPVNLISERTVLMKIYSYVMSYLLYS